MLDRLPSTISNAIRRKNRKCSSLLILHWKCYAWANLIPRYKALPLDQHTIPVLHGVAGIPVGINDLLNSSSTKSINEICHDITKIALGCRSHNVAVIFIPSIAYSTQVNLQSKRNSYGLL